MMRYIYILISIVFFCSCSLSVNVNTPSNPVDVSVYSKRGVLPKEDVVVDEVDEIIKSKTPLYLTSNSNTLLKCNEFSLSSSFNNFQNGFCYNYVFSIERNELKKMPLLFNSPLFPVQNLSNGLVLCVTKPNDNYYNVDEYVDSDKVIVNLNRAKKYNEISYDSITVNSYFENEMKNQLPIFLTNNSNSPTRCNELKFYNESFQDFYDGLCYGSIFQDYKNEINSLPLNFKGSLFPIKQINSSTILAVTNPKRGLGYYDVLQYNDSAKILINVKEALNSGEISNLPPELSTNNCRQYFKHLQLLYNQINSTCFSEAILANYLWKDEFQKRDYIMKFNDYLNVKSEMIYSSELYIDYLVDFGEYDFTSSSYEISINQAANYSPNISDNLFSINVDWSSNSFFENFAGSGLVKIKMDETKAREINNMLTDGRSMLMRVMLYPSSKKVNKLECNDVLSCVLPFSISEFKFSSNYSFDKSISP